MLKHFWQADKRKVKRLVEGESFDQFIMMLICMDAMILGFAASGMFPFFMTEMFVMDRMFMAIFIVEMLMKLYAHGPKFFKNGWNVFDLVVISVSAVSLFSYLIILRAFRLFRLLKYLKRFERAKKMFNTFVVLLPSFMAVLVFFAVFFFVFAVMGVSLFGQTFETTFGDLDAALFSLLQVFTLDNWSTIARPIMVVYPYAWIFFVAFMFVSFITVVSFMVTVIGDVVNGVKKNGNGVVPKTEPVTPHQSSFIALTTLAVKDDKPTPPSLKIKGGRGSKAAKVGTRFARSSRKPRATQSLLSATIDSSSTARGEAKSRKK